MTSTHPTEHLVAPCRHHWMIESPSERLKVKGVCSLCGATRDYKAGWVESDHYGKGRYKGEPRE